jgi:hypothetical protein
VRTNGSPAQFLDGLGTALSARTDRRARRYTKRKHKKSNVVITTWNPDTLQGAKAMITQAKKISALGTVRTFLKEGT